MGLFKKESCCLCGGKTGLLDKTCADGKVCRECRSKLSVWFDDYKTASVSELNAQLEQKEADVKKAAELSFNKVFGEVGCILIDESSRVFTVFADTSSGLFGEQREVHSIEDVLDLRPDLISFDQVKDIEIDIQEMTHEEKKTVDGKQVGYDPPHLQYSYTFTLRMEIDHPYIKRAFFPLNREAVKIKTTQRRVWTDPGRRLAAQLLHLPGLVKENTEKVYNNESLLEALLRSPHERPDMSYGFKVTNTNWDELRRYHYYLIMAGKIRESIMGSVE